MEYAVFAWPTGGFAEMRVAQFDTKVEAETDMEARRARYPRWSFRVAPVASVEVELPDGRRLPGSVALER